MRIPNHIIRLKCYGPPCSQNLLEPRMNGVAWPSLTTAACCQREAWEASAACLGWTLSPTGFTSELFLILLVVILGALLCFCCGCVTGSVLTGVSGACVHRRWPRTGLPAAQRWRREDEEEQEKESVIRSQVTAEVSVPTSSHGPRQDGVREVRRTSGLARKTFVGQGGKLGG